MNDLPLDRVAKLANADAAAVIESVQSLWSGYGQIVRVRLLGTNSAASKLTPSQIPPRPETAIVKHVCPPQCRDHKYGWTGDLSHQRKLDSYDNETNWYRNASQFCNADCRVPKLMGAESKNDATTDSSSKVEWLLVMEDLDAAGFHLRHRNVTDAQVNTCLSWLANFHATFLFETTNHGDKSRGGTSPAKRHQLWPTGTYWHLATRPDELAEMQDGALKQAASKIDSTLNNARFQTLVHGDAKLANFCFAADDQVAAVDFQYVGDGCGMKDVAYFISSCFNDHECERREQSLLDIYFQHLETALINRHPATPVSFADIETEWRSLYSVAWADFYRFLVGWSPGHWKMHGYSERVTRAVLDQLR